MRRPFPSVAGCLLLCSGLLTAAPPKGVKSGVRPSVLSLPTGPGSVEGLGKAFEPQLNTGTSAYSVSIRVPPGVAGHQPDLALTYHSGAGNGPLGVGWTLDLPAVTRQTEKGVPRYTAPDTADKEDVFVFRGEELVPLSDGTYRLRNESGFYRFRKSRSQKGGPVDSWECHLPDGRRYTFGAAGGERVGRGGQAAPPFAETYAWYVSEFADTSGNKVTYRYVRFDDSPGVLYPAEIDYARFGDRHHRVAFAYSGSVRFPQRPDVFSDFRPGFEVRTARRLCEIVVSTDGRPVRRYVLGYRKDEALAGENAPASEFSLLQSVTQYDGTPGDKNYLPPTRFAYTAGPANGPAFRPVAGGNNFLRFDPGRTAVVDINADGLPDFVASGDSGWYAYLNRGRGTFSDEIVFGSANGKGKSLTEASLSLADLDGDGAVDLIQKTAESGRVLAHANVNAARPPVRRGEPEKIEWGPEREIASVVAAQALGTVALADPAVRFLDLNGDKRTDLMRPFDGGVEYLLNLPGGWESRFVRKGSGPELPVGWDYAVSRFDQANDRRRADLADLNGDRLQDWYTLEIIDGHVKVSYWPNANGGRWATRRSMIPVKLGQAVGLQADDFRLFDTNGDGIADLVLVQNRRLTVWVNLGGERWGEPVVRGDAPAFVKGTTVLREMDVNGNGTTDLFWDNSGVGTVPESRYVYFDFVGGVRPNLLRAIDNGIGGQTSIEYGSSSDDYLQALAENEPFLTKMPFPVPVVRRVTTAPGLDLNGDGRPDESVTEYSYRDGYYDPVEKAFRGFAFVQRVEYGEGDGGAAAPAARTGVSPAPGLVTRFRFHTGAPDGVDNDDYLDDWTGARGVDEGSGTGRPFNPANPDPGGREEEALKGRAVFVETVDPVAISAPPAEAAGFHQAAVRSGRANPYQAEGQRCTPDRYVYQRVRSTWKLARLYRPHGVANPPGRFPGVFALSPRSVTFPFEAMTETDTIEANGYLSDHLVGVYDQKLGGRVIEFPRRPPVTRRTNRAYDGYGNLTRLEERTVGAGDEPGRTDSRVTTVCYALGGEALTGWLLNRRAVERVRDGRGRFASESRYYYDGPELEGLPLGTVGARGLLKRHARVVTENPKTLLPLGQFHEDRVTEPGDPRTGGERVVSTRTGHDPYGNVVVVLDPLGNPKEVVFAPWFGVALSGAATRGGGHVRVVTFDAERHTYPVEERVVVGEGKADLVAGADWHPGFGALIALRDFNGNKTECGYDSFGRLVMVVKPGDSLAAPTVRYAYRPADPHRWLVYHYDEIGTLLGGKPRTASGPLAGAVETRRRTDLSSSKDYHVSRQIAYSSGFGQPLMTIEDTGEPGRWVVTGARLYSPRGTEVATYQPYFRSDGVFHRAGDGWRQPDGKDSPRLAVDRVADRTEVIRDPTGRELERVMPPEKLAGQRAREVTLSLPLETRHYDTEDCDPVGEHRGTPRVLRRDGLGRLVEVMELCRLTDDGRPREGDAPAEWKSSYRYDGQDNLVWVKDAQGNVTWTRYDGLGRKIHTNHPDRGAASYTYDAVGNLTETVDAKGQRVTNTYDGVNRLLTEDYHDEAEPFSHKRVYDKSRPIAGTNRPDVSYHYDSPVPGSGLRSRNTKGELAQVVDLSGEEHLSHDERGRVEAVLKKIRDPRTGRIAAYLTTTTYDAADRMRVVKYPDGDELAYEYDGRGLTRRIAAVRGPDFLSDIEHAPSGQEVVRTYGNRVRTRFEYDPRLRVSRRVTERGEVGMPTRLIDCVYAYDLVSNVTLIEDRRDPFPAGTGSRVLTQRFEYDSLYRLDAASTSTGGKAGAARISYRYDRVGNMLGEEEADGLPGGRQLSRVALGYGGARGAHGRIGRDRKDPPGPHALTSGDGAPSRYDGNGNVTQLGDRTLTWDFKDRLVGVNGPEAKASYVHDYSGRRILRAVERKPASGNGGIERVVVTYIGDEFEIDAGGRGVKYVLFGGERVARVVGSFASPVEVRYFHTDHRGSTALVTGPDGVPQEEYYYEPFGKIRADRARSTRAGIGTRSFSQTEIDETGCYAFPVRHLDSARGRFLSCDPMLDQLAGKPAFWQPLEAALTDPQRLNPYSYALNRPLTYVDPSGANPALAFFIAIVALDLAMQAPPYGSEAMLENYQRAAHKVGDAMLVVEGAGLIYRGGRVGFSILTRLSNRLAVSAGEGVAEGMAEGVGHSTPKSPVQALRLRDSLAAKEMWSKAMVGEGTPILGSGTGRVLRKAGELASEYGGQPADWAKMTRPGFTPSTGYFKGMYVEPRWYQNLKTGQIILEKSQVDKIWLRPVP